METIKTFSNLESYQQIKARHQADVNAFPLGAAFSDKQLAEMMAQFGLPNDKSGYAQIVSLGYGCFILRSDAPAWREMCERHDREMKEFRKNRKELKKALFYEFGNHESQFNLNEETICNCVGLDWEEVQNDAELLKLFKDTYREFYRHCIEHDLF